MRLIGHLPAEAEARRFVDYLAVRRVAAHAEQGQDGQWQIWLENDDLLDAGKVELEQFRQSPADARYDDAADAAKVRRDEQRAAEKRQRNYRDVRTTLFTRPNGVTPVTYVVIGLCVSVFVLLNFGGTASPKVETLGLFVAPPGPDATEIPGMFDSILAGQIWRIVTPAFMHYGLLHLAFNLMWMLDLGRRIEPVKGSGKLLMLVLTTAALSCTAEAAWVTFSPFDKDHYTKFLGLSGVVSGLFGYCWAVGRFRSYERIGVGAQETGYMIGWLVICSFGIVGPIANAAHWGGLIAGGLIGAMPSLWKRR